MSKHHQHQGHQPPAPAGAQRPASPVSSPAPAAPEASAPAPVGASAPALADAPPPAVDDLLHDVKQELLKTSPPAPKRPALRIVAVPETGFMRHGRKYTKSPTTLALDSIPPATQAALRRDEELGQLKIDLVQI